jgi:hypothetical protein
MDNLLQYVFLEIIGNLFFRIGRIILRAVTFGSVRLEHPTRFQMFVVAMFGIILGVPAALLLINFILVWVVK